MQLEGIEREDREESLIACPHPIVFDLRLGVVLMHRIACLRRVVNAWVLLAWKSSCCSEGVDCG